LGSCRSAIELHPRWWIVVFSCRNFRQTETARQGLKPMSSEDLSGCKGKLVARGNMLVTLL